MNIFFVYDTTYCTEDEDDPKDAVLYFFPPQVYENRYSLCCQLAGVAKFMKSAFSSPSVIVFEEGRFAFQWADNYLFVLGENTDVHTNVIKRQLSFLTGIFCFYHGSMGLVLKESRNNRQQFLAKLDIAWSRYITLMQCFDNLLHLPVNPLPLSSSKKHLFFILKANRLLQLCQLNPSVIAGAVFCNSRILASQLTPEVTFYLTLMSNVNASSPVTNVPNSMTDLPPDVELKYVYLSRRTIANILKFNHVYVGSHIRMKKDHSKVTLSTPLTMSSGSEGDVDSGNCSESLKGLHRKNRKVILPPFGTLPKKYQEKWFSCCAFHVGCFRRNLFVSKPQKSMRNFELHPNFTSTLSEEDSGVHSQSPLFSHKKEFQRIFCDNQASSSHLICNRHASLFAAEFMSNFPVNHNNFNGSCDLEFACSYCITHHTLPCSKHLRKRWNSEIHIPKTLMSVQGNSASSSDKASVSKVHKNKKLKLQILKCRSKSASHSRTRHSPHHLAERSASESSFSKAALAKERFEFPGVSSEKDDPEKMVLFVQRCGACTLLLLLKKKYENKVLKYLWNCGFSLLKDLEHGAEKMLENYVHTDATSYLLLYNNSQEVLKEHPCFAHTRFSEKLTKEIVSNLQEDFISDPSLHLMCLMCTHLGVCGCRSKEQSAFFLQHDINVRKVEGMPSLKKRAVGKFEKYMKITL